MGFGFCCWCGGWAAGALKRLQPEQQGISSSVIPYSICGSGDNVFVIKIGTDGIYWGAAVVAKNPKQILLWHREWSEQEREKKKERAIPIMIMDYCRTAAQGGVKYPRVIFNRIHQQLWIMIIMSCRNGVIFWSNITLCKLIINLICLLSF